MSILDNEPIPRRTMVLFFVVDTSGSMSGKRIGKGKAKNPLPFLNLLLPLAI
jgi:hypothetical protein